MNRCLASAVCLAALTLASCGKPQVPKCSDTSVTAQLADLFVGAFPESSLMDKWHSVARTGPGFFQPLYVAVVRVGADLDGLRHNFKFDFNNERERSNEDSENLRRCTVDVAFKGLQNPERYITISPNGLTFTSSTITDPGEILDIYVDMLKDPEKLSNGNFKLAQSDIDRVMNDLKGGAKMAVKFKATQDYSVNRLEKGGFLVSLDNN